MRGWTVLIVAVLGASSVAAHPHVFIETGLKVRVDDRGRATGVEVSWTYDALSSLLWFEDLQLDRDGDGRLTKAELEKLDGFDMNWVRGFPGDVYVRSNGKNVALGQHQPMGVSVEDGLITSVHFRPFEAPAAGLEIKAYDPSYYTAYSLSKGVDVTGPCLAMITPANLDKAYTALEELLYVRPSNELSGDFPAVGESFADRVDITCD